MSVARQPKVGGGRPEEDGVRAYLRETRTVLDDAFRTELHRMLGKVVADASLVKSLNEGKKIRGCLTCLVGETLGAPRECTVPRAVAVELIQAATLIHDDYVDQDRLRRNKPAVWTVEGSRRAVLIGDVMFASAINMMSCLGSEDGSAVARAIALISLGALYEPLGPEDLYRLVQDREGDGNLYREIIRLKTGILFGTACELGAIAAGANQTVRRATYEYGVQVGEAYQMADDLTEIERCLARHAVTRNEMIALAPAFARFAPAFSASVADCMNRASIEWTGGVAVLLKTAKRSMENSIESSLQSATRSIEEGLPRAVRKERLRRAPWAMVAAFQESEAGRAMDR
jgi:hypothetical protein